MARHEWSGPTHNMPNGDVVAVWQCRAPDGKYPHGLWYWQRVEPTELDEGGFNMIDYDETGPFATKAQALADAVKVCK